MEERRFSAAQSPPNQRGLQPLKLAHPFTITTEAAPPVAVFDRWASAPMEREIFPVVKLGPPNTERKHELVSSGFSGLIKQIGYLESFLR